MRMSFATVSLTSVPTAEVVPGDILVVEEGDTVAADARVIQSAALQHG